MLTGRKQRCICVGMKTYHITVVLRTPHKLGADSLANIKRVLHCDIRKSVWCRLRGFGRVTEIQVSKPEIQE